MLWDRTELVVVNRDDSVSTPFPLLLEPSGHPVFVAQADAKFSSSTPPSVPGGNYILEAPQDLVRWNPLDSLESYDYVS